MHRLQVRCGVRTQLLAETSPNHDEGVPCFVLPAGAVQSQHQQPVASFTNRFLFGQALKFRYDCRSVAHLQPCFEKILRRVLENRFQPSSFAVQIGRWIGVRQDPSTLQSKTGAESVDGLGPCCLAERPPGIRKTSLKTADIDVPRVDVESVALPLAYKTRGLSAAACGRIAEVVEPAPKVGDVGVEAATRSPWRTVGP